MVLAASCLEALNHTEFGSPVSEGSTTSFCEQLAPPPTLPPTSCEGVSVLSPLFYPTVKIVALLRECSSSWPV
jgi:hypothetical protein